MQTTVIPDGDRILLFSRRDDSICSPAIWCQPLNDFELFRVGEEGSVRWHRSGDRNAGMVHLDHTGTMWWLRYEDQFQSSTVVLQRIDAAGSVSPARVLLGFDLRDKDSLHGPVQGNLLLRRYDGYALIATDGTSIIEHPDPGELNFIAYYMAKQESPDGFLIYRSRELHDEDLALHDPRTFAVTARFDRDGQANPPASEQNWPYAMSWHWQLMPDGRLYSYGWERNAETNFERRLSLFTMPGSDADPDWLLRTGFESSH